MGKLQKHKAIGGVQRKTKSFLPAFCVQSQFIRLILRALGGRTNRKGQTLSLPPSRFFFHTAKLGEHAGVEAIF